LTPRTWFDIIKAHRFFVRAAGLSLMKHLLCMLLFGLAIPSLHAQPVDGQLVDEAIKEALSSWRVPGAALAVVKDNQLVYLKGHGVRELGTNKPITADTVFPIASCTKAFTSLAMGMLVDEGKLNWDDLVREHIPTFRLADPLADAQVTLRDLLTHRTGIGRHELLWYRAPWGLEERIRRIGFIKPEKAFRAGFEYQSVLYGTAGYAAGKAAGTTWQDLLLRRIVQPLNMKATSFTTVDALRHDDLAMPHRRSKDGTIAPIPWYPISEPDPAGSINSTARDLASFLKLQLSGTWNGKELISPASRKEPHTPQMPIRVDGYVRLMNPDTLQISYGMGWVIQDYRGELLLMHGGVIDGFRAHLTLLPRKGIGIVLLNNLHGVQMNLALSNTLVDMFLGVGYRDWNGYYQKVVAAETKVEEQRARLLRARQQPGGRTSRDLDAYAGAYHDAAYGTALVTVADGKLVLRWSTFTIPLEHFNHDTFLANNDVVVDALAQFVLNTDGDVECLKVFGRDFVRK